MSPSGGEAAPVAERLKRAVVSHYEAQLRRHGATARGMDWKDEESQRLRFELLCDVCDLTGRSVYEVGAGAGHLYAYLRERGVGAKYSGCDLSAEMVTAARDLDPGASIELRDILTDPPNRRTDIVLCSGVFHVKLDHSDDVWRGFVHAVIARMYAMCDHAIAFNLMTDRVDYRSDRLYYASPGSILDFCRDELSRYVALRHDYPLHEFTTYVYRHEPLA
jgi:SAM-dependent methyltransferase